MLTDRELAVRVLSRLPLLDVKAAYIDVLRALKGRPSVDEYMSSRGWEITNDVDLARMVTSDGRIVVSANGKNWVLGKAALADRLARRFSGNQERTEASIKDVAGTEALSVMVCPKCGDGLQHTAVCPKCAAGQLGYRHRYTCVCGGVDFISKDKL